jgi:hypothetical protein
MRKETGTQVAKTDNKPISGNLISDIRRLIETARQNVAVAVNTGLTILYPNYRKPLALVPPFYRRDGGRDVVSRACPWGSTGRSAAVFARIF